MIHVYSRFSRDPQDEWKSFPNRYTTDYIARQCQYLLPYCSSPNIVCTDIDCALRFIEDKRFKFIEKFSVYHDSVNRLNCFRFYYVHKTSKN